MLAIPYATLDDLIDKLEEVGLKSDPLVNLAIEQARHSHGKKIRRGGKPVLEEHIYPVTISVIDHQLATSQKTTPQLVAGALLHDVPDDDKDMPIKLFREKFGEEVYRIVESLTDRFAANPPSFFRWAKQHLLQYSDYAIAHFILLNLYKHMPNREQELKSYFRALAKAPKETKIIRLADRYNNLCCINEPASVQGGKFTVVFRRRVSETERFYLPFAKRFSPYFHELLYERVRKLTDYFRTH